jgi:hypothetical protein
VEFDLDHNLSLLDMSTSFSCAKCQKVNVVDESRVDRGYLDNCFSCNEVLFIKKGIIALHGAPEDMFGTGRMPIVTASFLPDDE